MTDFAYVPFDILQLLLNIFRDDDEANNLAIRKQNTLYANKQTNNTLFIIEPNPKFEERVKYRSICSGKILPDKWLLYH